MFHEHNIIDTIQMVITIQKTNTEEEKLERKFVFFVCQLLSLVSRLNCEIIAILNININVQK